MPQQARAFAADTTEAGDTAALRHGWRVFGVTSLGLLLCFLNSSTLQVALPTLARELGTGVAAGWILLSYMLVNTVCILAFGRLSDLVGRRRLYIFGLVVFMLGCAGCAAAPSLGLLIAARVVQGIGAAAIIANNAALLADAFPKHALAVALGYNSTISAIAQVSGPALGGAVITLFGWQAVFLFNLPFGMLSLLLGLRILRPVPPRAGERFDALGCALSMLLLGSLVVALSGGPGMEGAPRLVAGLVALLALPAFLLSQLRRPHPLVDLRLFRDPGLCACFTGVCLVAAALAGTGLVAALFLQSVQAQSAFGAGWRVMALAAGMVTAGQLVARILLVLPAALAGAAGAGLMMVALAVLAALLSPQLPYPVLAAGLFLVGFGNTCFMSPCTGAVMLRAPAERRGMANGLRATLQNTGMLVGTAVTAALAGRAALGPEAGGAALGSYRLALAILALATALAAAIMLAAWWRERPGLSAPR